jgi:hypothetical protein
MKIMKIQTRTFAQKRFNENFASLKASAPRNALRHISI